MSSYAPIHFFAFRDSVSVSPHDPLSNRWEVQLSAPGVSKFCTTNLMDASNVHYMLHQAYEAGRQSAFKDVRNLIGVKHE